MSQDYLKAFGATLRRIRKARGLSQEEFAHVASLDRSYVGQIERGEKNITLMKIRQIADALDMPVSAIFKNLEESQ